MTCSMTGFGRGSAARGWGMAEAEIRTVNSRFLEINLHADKRIAFAEPVIRKILGKELSRGKADVNLTVSLNGKEGGTIVIHEECLREYAEAMEKARKICGMGTDRGTLSDVMPFSSCWMTVTEEKIPEEELIGAIQEAVQEAVGELSAMREKEGENLRKDLLSRLTGIEEKTEFLCGRQKELVIAYTERLRKKLTETLSLYQYPIDEARILEEAAVFSDRVDYTEEMTRFASHIGQFRSILEETGPVGRKLDFLIQEMNREINTTGSKASDLEAVNCVIMVKNELEKIREQVQNIE